MTGHHDMAKHIGDVGASVGTAFVAVSQFAEIATPILAMLIGLMTLVWWLFRFWDRFNGARPADD